MTSGLSKKSLFSIFLTLLLFIHFCFSQIESYGVAVTIFDWVHDVSWKLQQDICFIMEVIKFGNCLVGHRSTVREWINVVESVGLVSLLSLVRHPGNVLLRSGLPWVDQDSEVLIPGVFNGGLYSLGDSLVGGDGRHHSVFLHCN